MSLLRRMIDAHRGRVADTRDAQVDGRHGGLCGWVKRWTPGGTPPPMLKTFNIIQLDNDHRDFRQALGLPLVPDGKQGPRGD